MGQILGVAEVVRNLLPKRQTRKPSPETQRVLLRLLKEEYGGDINRWFADVQAQERHEISCQESTSTRLRIDWEEIDDAMLAWALELLGESPEPSTEAVLRLITPSPSNEPTLRLIT